MKIFKVIMNCVIATLLVVSVVVNIFVLAGFRIVDSNTYTLNINVSQNALYDHWSGPRKPCNKQPSKHEHKSFLIEEPEEPVIRELVYQDNNITVFYRGIKEDSAELTYLFEVKNTSSTTLNITFNNLTIDGKRVYVSGLTCEKLLPGNVTIEDFVVKEVDGSQDSDSGRVFTFNLKLMNAKSYLDLYESDTITFVS